MSKNKTIHVTNMLNTEMNIINRIRPAKGSIKRPTFTVPDVQRHVRQAIDVIYKKNNIKLILPMYIKKYLNV